MPNTTSGTNTFDKSFAIDEIIEEAYQRIGLSNMTGYQLTSARRSLEYYVSRVGLTEAYTTGKWMS